MFEKVLRRVLHMGFLAARPMTLGVRVAAFDAEGRVFLVKHTYVAGWYMPGGGIDPGETAQAAAAREMAEEGNIEAPNGLSLLSVHFNNADSKRDHVILYRADGVVQTAPKKGDGEIAETGFFALDDLPQDTTPATRRRLDEIRSGSAADPYW